MIWLVLLLGGLIRLISLQTLPISLFGDELDVGYQAWSLWTTGRDYMGHYLPTYIQSLNEWRAPLLMYVVSPFVGLLGPNSLSVRLPIALLGILNLYQIYLLTNLIFPKRNKTPLSVGLFASLILALTPWHIHYSRVAFESTLLLSLLLSGTYFYIKSHLHPSHSIRHLSLAVLSFVLTFYTYSTANLFTPLLVITLLLTYRPSLKVLSNKKFLISSTPATILFIIIAFQIVFGSAATRFSGLNITNSQEIVDSIIKIRTQPWVESSSERPFHNRPQAILTEFGSQYFSSLSPEFLFLYGDTYLRHGTARYGVLLWVMAPFLVYGLALSLTDLKKQAHRLLIFWLLFAPIASSLTQNGAGHATRLFVMLPPLIILSANGLYHSFSLVKYKHLYITVIAALLAINAISFYHYYANHYKYLSSEYWHYGYEQVLSNFDYKDKQVGRIFINNIHEPAILPFVFYTHYPPRDFQNNYQNQNIVEDIVPEFDGFLLGENVYFGRVRPNGLEADISDKIGTFLEKGDYLLAVQNIDAPGDWDWETKSPDGVEVVESVKTPLGLPLFYLLTSTK